MPDTPNTSSSSNDIDLILPDPSPVMPDEIKNLDDIPAMCFKHAEEILRNHPNPEQLNYGKEAHIMDEPFVL